MVAASPLLTDLYQLTMLQSYLEHDMQDTAVFEFFVRKLPQGRNFLVAAGLAQVVEYLQTLHFSPKELDWLAADGQFNQQLIDYLSGLRFTGDVDAMAEGTVFFPDEPILRVVAPLPLAQLVETRIINLLHFQTLIASKAARVVLTAPAKLLVDFGLRRAHGAEAGLLAARACYLAGFSGSATVQAGIDYGIPIYGTMAHSYILAHDNEVTAFEHFSHSYPSGTTLLIDTYDTEAAAAKLVRLARKLPVGAIRAVRLDSGDLAEHARKVRTILNQGGLQDTNIFVSGNLDEYLIHDMLSSAAPIDGFGVGTRLDTSADASYLDCAYKLQEYAGVARRKRSEGKSTWPGRKQVYRHVGDDGRIIQDTLTLLGEKGEGEPLLHPVMRGGKLVSELPALEQSRQHCKIELSSLPETLRQINVQHSYTVEISARLSALAEEVDRKRS